MLSGSSSAYISRRLSYGALCRCEAVRHCRWVDEVIPASPWILNPAFLEKWKIDYVAHDEVPYGAEGHDDVYAFVKQQGVASVSADTKVIVSDLFIQGNLSLPVAHQECQHLNC